METGARTFPEAVRELAAGVESRYQRRARRVRNSGGSERQKSLKRRLLDVQDILTGYYSDQLFGPPGQGRDSTLNPEE